MFKIFKKIFKKKKPKKKVKLYNKNLLYNNKNNKCSICFDKIKKNGMKTKCNHFFHINCLYDWYKIKKNCPYCRKKLGKLFIKKKRKRKLRLNGLFYQEIGIRNYQNYLSELEPNGHLKGLCFICNKNVYSSSWSVSIIQNKLTHKHCYDIFN